VARKNDKAHGTNRAKENDHPARVVALTSIRTSDFGCGFGWRRNFHFGFRFAFFTGFCRQLLSLQLAHSARSFLGFVVLFAHISLYFIRIFRFCVGNMVIRAARFNIYLCFLATGVLVTGCLTARHEKQLATLRIHLEVTATAMDFSASVPVFREQPVMINVDREPFLTEADVASAKVVEDRGGFALQIEFDHSGTMLLEEYTTANTGRRMAVFAQFGKTKEESRWLAAPLIARRITNGRLIFTPDATREEAERIALGLNNLQEDKQKGGK